MSAWFSLRRVWALKWVVLLLVVPAALIALAASYRVSATSPYLAQRVPSEGVATVQIYIDSARSALGNATVQPAELAGRAPAYAELAKSSEIQEAAARYAGVPVGAFVVVAQTQTRRPAEDDAQVEVNTPAAGVPSVAVVSRADSPLLSVRGTAPSTDLARRQVTGVSRALREFVLRLQDEQGTQRLNQIRLRQLGDPLGGFQDNRVSIASVAALAVVAWLLLVALLILADATLRRGRAERRMSEAPQ